MNYVTSTGVRVIVGHVDRRVLDAIDIPKPQPPMRDVETWGNITERVPLLNDESYRRQLSDWRLSLFAGQWHAIAPALEARDVDLDEAHALQAAGLGEGRAIDVLRYTLSELDQIQIVAAVYYQSTVTDRAMLEAEMRFDYTWRGKSISSWSLKYAPGQRGQLAVHWRAA